MLLLVLACTLPPAPSAGADSAVLDATVEPDSWDICTRSLVGTASGTYFVDDAILGGCGGQIALWCDDGIRGAAELVCDGNLSGLTLDLTGVQYGSELGGRVAITAEDDAILVDWAADVATDLSVVGGFTTAGERLDGHYELWGAFAVGMPPSI